MLLDGEEKARIKRRNIYTETKRPFAAFPRATATPYRHASNIKRGSLCLFSRHSADKDGY